MFKNLYLLRREIAELRTELSVLQKNSSVFKATIEDLRKQNTDLLDRLMSHLDSFESFKRFTSKEFTEPQSPFIMHESGEEDLVGKIADYRKE